MTDAPNAAQRDWKEHGVAQTGLARGVRITEPLWRIYACTTPNIICTHARLNLSKLRVLLFFCAYFNQAREFLSRNIAHILQPNRESKASLWELYETTCNTVDGYILEGPK
jgi:hypothetical protein